MLVSCGLGDLGREHKHIVAEAKREEELIERKERTELIEPTESHRI